MATVTPLIVLKALVKHETLTLPDLMLEHNLGVQLPQGEIRQYIRRLRR